MEEILAHFFEGTELKEGVEIVQVEAEQESSKICKVIIVLYKKPRHS